MKTKKEMIDLNAASSKVFEHYLGPLFPGGFVVLGRNISNPFLLQPQKTPSFNLLQVRDGSLIFKDFATGEIGNCVTFVARLKGISRIEAIRIIRELITNN